MEVKIQSIERFFQTLPNNISSTLIYGSDEGLIFAMLKKILYLLRKNPTYNPSLIEYEYRQIKDYSVLMDEAISLSLFDSGSKILVINNCTETISVDFIKTLQTLETTGCFVILTSPDLKKTSKTFLSLQKFKSMAFVPCYIQERVAIAQLIRKLFEKHKVEYDTEIPKNLASILPQHYMLAYNEIQKLLLYKMSEGGYGRITHEDISDLFCDESEIAPDEIVLSFLAGNINDVASNIKQLQKHSVNPILFIKLLQNYVIRILHVKSKVASGIAKEHAIAALKPPVFWKYKASLMQLSDKLSYIRITGLMLKLIDLELACKADGKMQYTMIENFLISAYNANSG